jgi:aminomuconate-semialdehyde/2-hydroxymuconate-6-semialdehyde dehydrogenase
MEHIKNFINGELLEPISRQYFENYEPATGQVYSYVADSDERDLALAVAAAEQAFPAWSVTPAPERARMLQRLSDLIAQNLEPLARAESVDTGKPLSLARRMDIPRAASNLSFFASAIVHFASESHAMEEAALNYTLRKPLGLVGCISPWNLPLYLFTWKIAPALAAGNCVVAKPSELTPVTAQRMAELCQQADLPAGVLNIVHGRGPKAGAALGAHPKIAAISFTGGTKTGAEIARVASPLFKKLSLELGGKNPVLVFADCDYPSMLETTVRSAFTNQGQICLCGSRVFIERPLYERLRADLVARAKQLKVGDPLVEETDQGALISAAHHAKVLSYIELARQEGGTILCGGHEVRLSGRCKGGWFVAPTVIEGLSHMCRTNQEEIFGPVVTLMPFETEDEALTCANSTPYGLASILWTGDLTRAHRVADQLKSGIVWVNCWMVRDLRTPFGGMKQSGVGREGGWEALRFFTEPKNVCVKLK